VSEINKSDYKFFISKGERLKKNLKPNVDPNKPDIINLKGRVHLYNSSVIPFTEIEDEKYYLLKIKEYKEKTFNTFYHMEIRSIKDIIEFVENIEFKQDVSIVTVNPCPDDETTYKLFIQTTESDSFFENKKDEIKEISSGKFENIKQKLYELFSISIEV